MMVSIFYLESLESVSLSDRSCGRVMESRGVFCSLLTDMYSASEDSRMEARSREGRDGV